MHRLLSYLNSKSGHRRRWFAVARRALEAPLFARRPDRQTRSIGSEPTPRRCPRPFFASACRNRPCPNDHRRKRKPLGAARCLQILLYRAAFSDAVHHHVHPWMIIAARPQPTPSSSNSADQKMIARVRAPAASGEQLAIGRAWRLGS